MKRLSRSLKQGKLITTPFSNIATVLGLVIEFTKQENSRKKVLVAQVYAKKIIKDISYLRESQEVVNSDIVVFNKFDGLSTAEKLDFSHSVKSYWEVTNKKKTILIVTETPITNYNSDLVLRAIHMNNIVWDNTMLK